MSTAQPPATPDAGTHLIADFWGVDAIDSIDALERVVRSAVAVAGATLLDLRFHQFPGHGGITGYAMLAESHISVHTWPERDYVAIDVFMCGEQRPGEARDVLRRAFRPSSERISRVRRGIEHDGADVDRRLADRRRTRRARAVETAALR